MNALENPRLQLMVGVLVITALFVWLVRRVLRRFMHAVRPAGQEIDTRVRRQLLHAAVGPLTLLVWYYGLYAMAHVAIAGEWLPAEWRWLDDLLRRIASVGLVISLLWFFHRATKVADLWLRHRAEQTESRLDDVLLPLIGTALRLMVPIIALFLLSRIAPVSTVAVTFADKVLSIALIAALTWVLRRAILLVDAALIGPRTPTTPAERALFTRVRVLRKIAMAMITVFAFSAVLMSFEEVRDIGRSLLASAGIAGIIIGFAAQRSLGNLFAGLQIALTQPVRIGDQVLVEGDVGNVEEITLTYVVVRVWDGRRIVLPISYFIEKPFQNWTRVTTTMLSPLTMRFDFSLPVAELREFLQAEIAKSSFWDKNVFSVQVTNADHNSMEVRVLFSVPDSGSGFNLQCELREKTIEFVRRNYPQCLPKGRQEQKRMEAWRAQTAGNGGDSEGRRSTESATATREQRAM